MKLIVIAIIFVAIYTIQQKIYRKMWRKGLVADLSFSRDYIPYGGSAELVETISNQKILPLPVFHLKYSVDRTLKFSDKENAVVTDKFHRNEVFSVMSNQKITRRLEFTGMTRGIAQVGNANVLVKDFFMVSTFADSITAHDSIYVLPEKIYDDSFEILFRGIIGEIEARRSVVTDEMTFRGLREYNPFDSYRSINWKQSARQGDLMVNLFGYSMNSEIRILLNLDTDVMVETHALIEKAISITSSLASKFIQQKLQVSVVCNGLDMDGKALLEIPAGAEAGHALLIDKMLTEIYSSAGYEKFNQILDQELKSHHENVYYLVVSPYHKTEMMEKLDLLEKRAGVTMILTYYDSYPATIVRPYVKGWEVTLNA